jgi:peptide-methionine (S)-S-oxide reductase
MTPKFQNVKATILAGLIVVAALVHSGSAKANGSEDLIVAGGCFWCVESDFESVKGVKEVISGYTGGTTKNPTYKQVTRGGTGHYEAVKIIFDPLQVSREELLGKFLRSVDPTDAGGQFCDRGESYRTAIFVEGDAERQLAKSVTASAQAELGKTIVTPILNEAPFYEAEEYHQDYYKGDNLVLTRFGPKTQAAAYKAYRKACGRDARVMALWGAKAPFTNNYTN